MSRVGADIDVAHACDLTTLDYSHVAIHDGNAFAFKDILSLGSAEIGSYMLTTPNTTKHVHFGYDVDSSVGFTFDLYEAVNGSGAIAQTVFNRNRNLATAAGMVLHKGCSADCTAATKISQGLAGIGGLASKLAGSMAESSEWVLKQNTKYVLKLTSAAASNKVVVKFNWFEHEPE